MTPQGNPGGGGAGGASEAAGSALWAALAAEQAKEALGAGTGVECDRPLTGARPCPPRSSKRRTS